MFKTCNVTLTEHCCSGIEGTVNDTGAHIFELGMDGTELTNETLNCCCSNVEQGRMVVFSEVGAGLTWD
jgi:hypothetical protein